MLSFGSSQHFAFIYGDKTSNRLYLSCIVAFCPHQLTKIFRDEGRDDQKISKTLSNGKPLFWKYEISKRSLVTHAFFIDSIFDPPYI